MYCVVRAILKLGKQELLFVYFFFTVQHFTFQPCVSPRLSPVSSPLDQGHWRALSVVTPDSETLVPGTGQAAQTPILF